MHELRGSFPVDTLPMIALTVHLSAVAVPGRSGHDHRTKSYSQILYEEEKSQGKLSL